MHGRGGGCRWLGEGGAGAGETVKTVKEKESKNACACICVHKHTRNLLCTHMSHHQDYGTGRDLLGQAHATPQAPHQRIPLHN